MRKQWDAGFTLVEVMAALVILAIAMTAVFSTFQFQQKSFAVQSRVAIMQQNLRDGLGLMARDVRMAGYGIPAPVTIPDGVIAAGVTSIRSLYPIDNTTGPDSIYILYMYDMDPNQPPTTITSAMPNTSAIFNVASTSGFVDGDLVIITNGTSSDLFEATTVTAASFNIQHNPGGSARDYNAPGGHNTFPPSGYDSGSVLSKMRFVRYYIDRTTDPAHPILMVDRMGGSSPQPVADDIEDLQFSYGVDSNADGVVDSWTASPATLSQVRQVRISLVARSRMPEQGWIDNQNRTIGNWTTGIAADGYRRRIADMVVDVRNSSF